MAFKYLAAALLFSATLLSPAQATIVTTTSTGVISSGQDDLSLFGAAGGDLTGLRFQMRISVDIDTNRRDTNPGSAYDDSFGSAPIAFSATIGNVTYTNTFNGWNDQYVSNGLSQQNGNYPFDEIYGYGNGGNDDPTVSFNATHYIRSNSAALEGLTMNLLDDLTYHFATGDTGYARFTYSNSLGTTTFSATPDFISLNDGASVPEPATLGIFGLGLAGLAASRRKRARR